MGDTIGEAPEGGEWMEKAKRKAVPCPESMASAKTDPQGSYTGVPADPGEKPVQDADDL